MRNPRTALTEGITLEARKLLYYRGEKLVRFVPRGHRGSRGTRRPSVDSTSS